MDETATVSYGVTREVYADIGPRVRTHLRRMFRRELAKIGASHAHPIVVVYAEGRSILRFTWFTGPEALRYGNQLRDDKR